MELEWIPPSGSPAILFRDAGPYAVDPDELRGLMSLTGDVTIDQAPGQWGGSLVAVSLPPRTLRMRTRIDAATATKLWELREELAGAATPRPTRPGRQASRGLLRLSRPGMGTVETAAVGRIVDEQILGPLSTQATIEWWVPDPRWRSTHDQTAQLEQGGGFTFPLVHPWHSLGANIQLEVLNEGTVEAPIVARIYGVLETPRLILLETGETIEVSGPVDDGDYLRIDTGFDRLSIELHRADGTVEDATHRLNLELADFWQLPPGTSTIRLEADDNPSGVALITWRPRWAGV